MVVAGLVRGGASVAVLRRIRERRTSEIILFSHRSLFFITASLTLCDGFGMLRESVLSVKHFLPVRQAD